LLNSYALKQKMDLQVSMS